MTDAPAKKFPTPWLTLLAAALAPLFTGSCSSTPKIQGLPERLPEIALNGSDATPPHNLPGYEYPFDAGGHYMTSWAAEGERRAGRSPTATSDDEKKWSKSHKGHVTSRSKKGSKKGSGKTSGKSSGKTSGKSSGKSSKKKSSTSDDKPKAKSGSKSSKKTPPKKSAGTSSKKKSPASSGASSKTKPKPKAKTSSKSSKTKKSGD